MWRPGAGWLLLGATRTPTRSLGGGAGWWKEGGGGGGGGGGAPQEENPSPPPGGEWGSSSLPGSDQGREGSPRASLFGEGRGEPMASVWVKGAEEPTRAFSPGLPRPLEGRRGERSPCERPWVLARQRQGRRSAATRAAARAKQKWTPSLLLLLLLLLFVARM
ncbi:hypothetical protein JRQ81_013463, partial [Phrynocephalus forsythii]